MPLHNAEGNLLDSGFHVLVNAVNCIGVAGAGLALQFKRRWPEQVAEYTLACREGQVSPGDLHEAALPDGRVILSVPTKRHWQDASHLADVSLGVDALVRYCRAARPPSMALPALGCGLGGLPRHQVRALFARKLSGLPCDIHIYGLGDK